MATAKKKVQQLPPDPDSKYEHRIEGPEELFALVQKEATRTDRSMSFIIQHAWTSAYARIASSDREALEAAIRPFGGKAGTLRFFAMGSMILQFGEQAARLGVSESVVVQAAIALAREVLEKLPVYDAFGSAGE